MEEAFPSKSIECSSIASELHNLSSVSSDDSTVRKNLESIALSDHKTGGSPAGAETSVDEEFSSSQQLSAFESTAFSDLKIEASPGTADEESSSAQHLSIGGGSPAAGETSVGEGLSSALQLREAAFESKAVEGFHNRKLENNTINEALEINKSLGWYILGKPLPDDITAYIMSKLPFKDMVEGRRLSKQSRDFLDSSEFKFEAPTWLVVLRVGNRTSFKIFGDDIKQVVISYSPKVFVPDHRLVKVTKSYFPNLVLLVGLAGGLLLLICRETHVGKEKLFLWNPLYPSYIEIGPPEIDKDMLLPEDGGKQVIVNYGFAWNEGCGYTIIQLSQWQYWGTDEGIVKCRVYSFPYEGWKEVDCGSFRDRLHRSHGTFYKDGIYWATGDHRKQTWISSYNTVTNSFSRLIEAPYKNLEKAFCIGGLSVINNQLCFCECSDNSEMNVWVLNEMIWEINYGIEVSALDSSDIRLLRVLKDGNFLLWTENGGINCHELAYYRKENEFYEVIKMYDSLSEPLVHIPIITPVHKIVGISGAGIVRMIP